jgi:DNA-binding NarL/FixJ family response regulator
MKYQIIHAERDIRFHESLKNSLSQSQEFLFVDHCCYLDSALQSLKKFQPAILITASKLYDETMVLDAFCDYRDSNMQDLKIIMLTKNDNLDHFLHSVVRRIEGYIHKPYSIDEISQCLNTVANGGSYLSVHKQTISF